MPKVKKKSAKSRTHKCPKCEKKFSDSSGLNRHLELHVEDYLHVCTVCNATFKTKRYLSRHRKRHSEPNEHECKDCGKKFHFKSSLNKHRLVHTNERPHKCKWCNKGFNSTYSLSSHILIHKNSKPFKCTFCDYACRDSSTLRKHQQRHIGQVPTYNCKICEKKFSQKKLLEFHVAKEHLNIDVNVLPCDKCGKMFRDNTSLKLHIQKIHDRLFAAKCPVCGVTISCKQNMEAHLRSHLDERPFSCTFEGCGKAFKDARALHLHEFLHYPERYLKCKFCDKRFSRQFRLNSHKKQHFLLKEKYVVCDYCNVRFYSKNYLKNHIATKHLYKNKYICDICNKEFFTKPSLIGHIIAHNSEMDKQCKLCKKTFKKHIYLKSHYLNTHCIKYKNTRKNVKINRTLMVQELKTEAAEKFVIKSEAISDTDEETEYSKSVLAEDLKASGNQMNIFYDIQTLDRNKIPKKSDPRINKELKETVKTKIKRLLQKAKSLKERCDLERARRRYNKRMENLLKREEPQTELTKTEVGKITCERDENGKLKFNVHQCYVCFTLYKTKEDLLDHCQQHFDLCHTNTLRKCPLCDHVSSLTIGRHLLRKHKIKTKLYTGNIKNNGSQFYYDLNGKKIDKLEVIPSVKLLNRQAYIDLDRKNREKKDKIIAKTKLVKKGTEWIVEKEKLNIENFKIPKLSEIDLPLNFGDDHCARMKSLSVATKQNGVKMLYPCDRCEKICQTLSALKLHYRRHDPNAKPFKPKVWKHKLKSNDKNPNNRSSNIVCDMTKRYVKPKPITSKHRCDPELIKFYESNIMGENIEFWQFLKIYNRMTRENIKDFSDLQNRTDFGIQPVSDVPSGTGNNISNCNYKITKVVGKKKRIPQLKVLRHILISKNEYKKRNEIKARLRQRLVMDS